MPLPSPSATYHRSTHVRKPIQRTILTKRTKAQLLHTPRFQLGQLLLIPLLTHGLRKLKQKLQHPPIQPEARLFTLLTRFVKLLEAGKANIQRRPECLETGEDLEVLFETRARGADGLFGRGE